MGGLKLTVAFSDRDYVSSGLYSASAFIEVTSDLAEHVFQTGGLDMQVSYGHRDIRYFIPANYFLGFSQKSGMGWGVCPAQEPVGS